jgi:hypothetical protein
MDRGPRPYRHGREATLRLGRPAQWRKRMSEIDLARLSQTVFEDLRYLARILMRNAGVSLLFVAIALHSTRSRIARCGIPNRGQSP